MTKQNNTKWLLKEALALDSMFGFYTQHERHLCHLYILGRSKQETPRMILAKQIIAESNWSTPESVYGQDRVLYYIVEGKKIVARDYINEHEIKQIVLTHLK